MRQWFLGVAFAFVAAGAATADDTAIAAVKKAIKAQGGAEALNKYQAGRFSMKGTVPVMGKDTEFTGDIAYCIPGKAKVNLAFEIMGQNVTIAQTMNGGKFKRTVKVGDMTVPGGDQDKDELKVQAAAQEIERLTPLLDAKRFTIKSGGEEDVNGKKATVVIATPKTVDKEVKAYFDQKSGMLVKLAHRGVSGDATGAQSEMLLEEYFSDFKKVNGVQIPMKMALHHDGKPFLTATLSDYELLEKIDDKEFSVED